MAVLVRGIKAKALRRAALAYAGGAALAVAELKDLVLRQDNSTIIAAYSWYLDHVANHFARMQLAGNIEAKILVELKTLIESIMGQQNNIFHLLIHNLFENNQSLSSPAARDEEDPTVVPEFSSAIEERVHTPVGLLDSTSSTLTNGRRRLWPIAKRPGLLVVV
jgi:hypothetical protein